MSNRKTHSGGLEALNGDCSEQRQLKLSIVRHDHDSLEVELVNRFYSQQWRSRLIVLLGLTCFYGIYKILCRVDLTHHGPKEDIMWLQVKPAEFIFLLALTSLIYSTSQLIKSEKLLFCRDFGLQIQILRCLSRKSSVFIPSKHIFDICINEVVENLDIHYILIVRTKGSLFSKQPIIPVFNRLKPPVDCLELIYKQLNQLLD